MRSPHAAVVTLAATTILAAGVGLSAPMTASASTERVSVTWEVTQDWGTGYQGAVTVTNLTGRALDPWSITVPYGNHITSIWDGTINEESGAYRFGGPSWSRSLAPGASARFGFIARPTGAPLSPTTCTTPAAACEIVGAATVTPAPAPAPTPTPTPTPTPAPTDPAPAPAPAPSSPTVPATDADITVGVKVVTDWGTGRNVDLVITNSGDRPIEGWSVTLPWSGTGISLWNATHTLSGGALTVKSLTWNSRLEPGASATVGFGEGGPLTVPTTCTSTVGSCAIAGQSTVTEPSTPPVDPTPTPADPTPTPADPTPTPVAPTPTPTPVDPEPFVPGPDAYTGDRKIVAYYTAWATYGRNYQVAEIPADKITHINYAFANIANGECVLGDSYADIDKAFAGDTWDQGALRGNFNQLQKLRQEHPRLKTLISIGGWTWSKNFSEAAATPQSRDAFVTSCVDFMKQYGFDGIDVDWEYPVSGGLYPGVAADKPNYTALLADFRQALDAEERADGRDYYLTIAAPAGPTTIPNLEADKMGSALDWMNLMSYDFHGSWDPITGHNAPMSVGPKDTATGFSVSDAVDAYLATGFPANKLVLGVPFYGRGWEGVSATDAGLYQPARGASVGTWEKGVFDYHDIVANYLPTMTRYWDEAAQVPYLYDPARGLWITYDDPQSMKAKTDFIKERGLGGAMFWELSNDRTYQLLDTLVDNL